MSPSRRQRYTLGHGVFEGEIKLDNGEKVWVGYLSDVVEKGTSNLNYLQDALEYIAARICEQESLNWIQIRSIFHNTTIQNDEKIIDPLGQHVTFTAARYVNGIVTESKTGHAYVSGIDYKRGNGRWYEKVELSRVRWQDQRGSSQGSQTQGGSSSTAVNADGWYPDPWTAESGKAQRYFANGQWTSHTN